MSQSSHNRVQVEATSAGLQNAALWWREDKFPSKAREQLEEALLVALASFLEGKAKGAATASRGRLPVEDALQIAKLAALKALSTWKPEKATYWSWCYTSVSHALRDAAAKAIALPQPTEIPIEEPTPTEGLSLEAHLDLVRALESLPTRERTVVTKYFLGGLTLAELGAELGIGSERVRQIRQRGLATLKKRFPHLAEDFNAPTETNTAPTETNDPTDAPDREPQCEG